jgi:probable rRNA maturation factor
MTSKKVNQIRFHLQEPFSLRRRQLLKSLIVSLFQAHEKPLESLDYIFVSDDFLLDINKKFLDHDFLTDIITFNLAEPDEPVIGEAYISVQRLLENAAAFNATVPRETHRLLIHAALHLCGHKDNTPNTKRKMRALEEEWLSTLDGVFHVKQNR